MEQELVISWQKIVISWKPICKNWKSFVINDTLCLGLFGGGNLELPLEKFGRFTTKSSLCHHFVHVIYNRTLPIIKDRFPRNGNKEIPNSHSGNWMFSECFESVLTANILFLVQKDTYTTTTWMKNTEWKWPKWYVIYFYMV